jgi:hypothetical protein
MTRERHLLKYYFFQTIGGDAVVLSKEILFMWKTLFQEE